MDMPVHPNHNERPPELSKTMGTGPENVELGKNGKSDCDHPSENKLNMHSTTPLNHSSHKGLSYNQLVDLTYASP